MAGEYVNVRIDTELKRRIQEVAKEENRTLSNLIETILVDYAKRQFMAKRK
ncbi:hypothetical protein NOC27_1200 [Nitrosococcus oceani AFC27]|uniref:CopG family transcriptional regulator n=1 Tax=Nitrosococcus oceani C-27 TaxID=314279 RepID=A0A0E2Z3C0_9GAMM|nr:hypothetical protein NOC27_1200 [Nitrosococcus oceani AFC27]KFI19686.1 CopG family transcriptional regulator [Nitrosococcus oceani C-27]GEM19602.1 hypothetical protein NONS58_09940 [Nitrosococcus oceani]